MAATIKIKNSSTASAVPTSSDLVQGELAVNVTDKRIFTENASGTVVELGTNPTILTMGAAGSASAPVITRTGDTNTGIFFPAADTIAFAEGGTETMRLDSAGNMGLGVTPSAWLSDYRVQQIGITSSVYGRVATNETGLTQNYYRDTSGAFKYIGNGFAAAYVQLSGGGHGWFNGANNSSGAGASLTLTQAMTLDASGNLGIGTTSPTEKLTVAGNIKLGTSGTTYMYGPSTTGRSFISNSDATAYIGIYGSSYGTGSNSILSFVTGTSNVMTMDSSGNLLVGTTSQPIGTARFVSSTSGTTYGGTFVTDTAGYSGLISWNKATSGTIYLAEFATGSSYVARGSITYNGTLVAYNSTSDYRLKNNQAPLTGSGAFIDALKPKTWEWVQNGLKGVGFIAHEFAEVSPSSVSGEKDAVDDEGNPIYQAMQASSSEVIANLVAEIQSIRKRLAAAGI